MKAAIAEFWKATSSARRKRRQRQIAELLRRRSPAFAKAAGAMINSLKRAVLPTIDTFRPPEKETYSGILDMADRMLIDWKAWEKTVVPLFVPLMTEVYRLSYGSVVYKARTDPIAVKAKAWATKNSARLVTEVSASTKKVIARTIRSGYDKGLPIREIAKRLRPVVGLTERQAERVESRYEEWLDDEMDEDKAWAKRERYSDQLERKRTVVIARTETAAAASEGTLEAYADNDIDWVDWVADPTACENCIDMEANGPYPIDEVRGKLPLHPNCECAWVMSLGE